MNNLTLVLLLSLLPMVGFSQLFCPPIDGKRNQGKNIDITLGAGATLLFGDINFKRNAGYGAVLKGDYHIIKGFYAGIEVQSGMLMSRGEHNTFVTDWDPRLVENQYLAGSLNFTVYPYRIFTEEKFLFRKTPFLRNVLYGFYIGVGFGAIRNNYNEIQRQTSYPFRNDPTPLVIPEGIVNGPHIKVPVMDADGLPVTDEFGNIVNTKLYKQNTYDKLIPILNAGLSIPLNKYTTRSEGFYSLVINTQFNFSKGEDLDGYNPLNENGSRSLNARNDMYNFSYLGLKYTF